MLKASLNNKGFTLIELLVALSIGTMVVLMSVMIFSQGVKHTRSISAESELLNEAAYLTDILTLNIRPALAINLISPDQLEITNSDLSISTLTYTGTGLQLDGNELIQPKVTVSHASFTIIDKTVQVNYELTGNTGSDINSVAVPFSATTTVALRN